MTYPFNYDSMKEFLKSLDYLNNTGSLHQELTNEQWSNVGKLVTDCHPADLEAVENIFYLGILAGLDAGYDAAERAVRRQFYNEVDLR